MRKKQLVDEEVFTCANMYGRFVCVVDSGNAIHTSTTISPETDN